MNFKALLPIKTFLVLICFVALRAHAEEKVSVEFQVKAACLYNFAKYVKWPDSSFVAADTPVSLCIFETNPFGTIFDNLSDKQVQGRPLTKKIVTAVDQNLNNCHLLYIPEGIADATVEKIEALTAGKPVLTVAEDSHAKSAVIHFVLEDGKVRFAIDQDAARNAALSLSSQLLRLAVSK